MGQLNIKKRGKVYQYQFEIARVNGKRKYINKSGFKAKAEAIIHFHDADYFTQNALHNCELINLDDMLQNGTNINGVMIEKPHRFITAATIATQIIFAVT